MADVNANIGVNIDTSDALNQLKNLQRQISQFHQSVAKSSSSAAIAQRDLQKNFINGVNAIKGFSAELRTVRGTAESFTNSLEKNKFSIQQYFRYAASQTKTFGKNFTSEFSTIEKTAIERVKTLQTQYVKMGRDAQGAMQAIAIRPTVLNMKDLGTQTAIAAQKQVIFNQLIKQGSTNLLNFGKNTQWAGRQLMVGFTLPLATLGMTAGRVFMDMEKAAIKFKKVYGDLFTAPGETQKALDSIVELGLAYTKYGVAVSDALSVASDAAAAGFQGVDLQNQTTASLKLSVLGQMELQKALETTIALQNAFRISSADLASEIDFLNAVENQTVVSLDDITEAVPRVAPVIQSLGGDVKDLAFFLAAMKEGGVNAAQGANALKSGLASLINPTERASEMLNSMGINIRGIVSQNQGDLRGTVVEFAQALDKLEPMKRAQAIEQLFGKFQFARISALFDNVIKEGSQASRVLDLAGSSIEELAALSDKELGVSAASAMNKFRAAVEQLKVALAPLGELFLEIATPFIDFATKVLDAFNNLPDGIKRILGTVITVIGGLGPVLLMTFGLINNGIANMIKFFATVRLGYLKMTGQAKGIGDETQYMTQEQLEAAAAASSLDQAHAGLTQRFTAEKTAVDQLRIAYEAAAAAGARFAMLNPGMMKPGSVAAPVKMAKGGVVSVGGRGNKDTEPALLTPGEAVIPAEMVKKYGPLIEGMIAGNIPGYANGVMLGMPRSAKSVSKNREASQEIYEMFLKSSYANTAPTEYGHQISPTSGHSFPIFGLGGVYQKGNKQVFVKPVLDEKAALAEMRSTEITRRAHGLEAPEQRIVVIRDPMDTTRQRRFLALESDLDPKFVNNQPMGVFNEDQYFKQLVASLLRVDKDLSGSNVYGNVVADAGPSGVFSRASGLRDYEKNLPSMEEQAIVNLLGIKGGAKRAFAESTLGLMAGLTPEQYKARMLGEIQKVLPRLKETIASFKLTDPTEVGVYDDMIKRLEQGLGVDWSKFHAIHSAVKPAKPKGPTQAAPQNFANGGIVKGPGGPKDDAIPANLSNGEAVIDAETVKKNPGIIAALFAKKKIQIPGYAENNGEDVDLQSTTPRIRNKRQRVAARFGEKGDVPTSASHMDNATVANLGKTLANTAETAKKFGISLLATEKVILTMGPTLEDASGQLTKTITETTGNIYEVADLAEKGIAGGGSIFAGTTILEPSARNLAYEVRAEDGQQVAAGAPSTLDAQVLAGERAASALRTQSEESVKYATQLQQLVAEGERARALLSQSNAHEERLAFMKEQSVRVITDSLQGVDGYTNAEAARTRALEILTHHDNELAKQVALGRTQQEQLEISSALLADAQTFAAKEIIVGDKNEAQEVRGVANAKGVSGSPIEYTRVVPEGEEAPRKRAFGGRSAAEVAEQNATEIEALGFSQAEANQRILESGMERFIRNKSNAPSDQIEEISAAGEQLKKDARVASPSQETIEASQGMVDGVKETLTNSEDDVAKATDEMLAPIAKKIRRSSTDPAVQEWVANQGKTQATTDSANIAAGTSRQPRRATREADNTAPTQKASGVASKFTDNLSKASFALSSVTGILYMFGNDLGGIIPVVSGASAAIFGLISISQALQGTFIATAAAARASSVAQAMGAATNAAGVASLGSLFVKGQGIAGLFKNLGTALKVGLRFLGPIGIALSVIAIALPFMVKAFEDSSNRINGLGAAANLTEEKLNFLAEKFGVTAKSLNWADRAKVVQATAGKSTEEKKQVVDLMIDPEFEKQFTTEIAGIKGATKEQAELALQALATQLRNSGFEQDAVNAIISGIVGKAERTDLELNFGSVLINDAKTAKAATDLAASAVSKFNKELEATSESTRLFADMGIDLGFDATSGSAAVVKSSIDSLTLAFESGNLSADLYTQSLFDLFNTLNSGEQPEWMLKQLAKEMGLEDVISGLTDAKDIAMLLQGAVSGVEINEEDIKILQEAADPKNAGASNPIQIKANKIRTDFAKATTAAAAAQQKLNQAKALTDELAETDAEAEAVQAQIDGYNDLVASGMNAELAYRLVGDSARLAAFQQAQLTDTTNGNTAAVDAFIANAARLDGLQKQFAGMAPGGLGGGGQKSAFQEAIDSLKEQQKEAKSSIMAYAKLRSAGFGVAEASTIAKDSMLAAALASQKVGSAKWNQLVTEIRAARAEEEAWLNSTPEGRAEHFADVYSKVMDVFNAQENIINMNNEAATATTRKMIEALEKQIEVYQRRSAELERDLEKISEKEDEINKAYDEKNKSLEKVKKLNQDIINQQKSQLSIADALSQGDIGAAAKAIQDSRAQNAAAQGDAIGNALDASRQAELKALTQNGKTRAEIEDEIKRIKKEIETIEFGALQNARDAVELADELAAAAIENLRVQGLSKTEWENINTRIDASKAKAALYEAEVLKALTNAQGLVGEWSKLNDTYTTTHVVNTIHTSSGGSGGGNGGTTTTTNDPNADNPTTQANRIRQAMNDKAISAKVSAELRKAAGVTMSNADRADTLINSYLAKITKAQADAILRAAGALSTGGGSGGFRFLAKGGMVNPSMFARGGFAKGTDTVPAMLTPGEYVVNKASTGRFAPLLEAINRGSFKHFTPSGPTVPNNFSKPVYNMPEKSYAPAGGTMPLNSQLNTSPSLTSQDNSVYNYSLSVNVDGTNASPDQIANVVMRKLQGIDSQRVKRQVIR